MNVQAFLAEEEARKTARRLPAARRRAEAARARADRRPTPENLNTAAELEAGLDRMELAVGLVTV